MDSNNFGTNANNPFRKLPYADNDSDPQDQYLEDELETPEEDTSIDYNGDNEDDEGYTDSYDLDNLI
jgi:hypothetical protein